MSERAPVELSEYLSEFWKEFLKETQKELLEVLIPEEVLVEISGTDDKKTFKENLQETIID